MTSQTHSRLSRKPNLKWRAIHRIHDELHLIHVGRHQTAKTLPKRPLQSCTEHVTCNGCLLGKQHANRLQSLELLWKFEVNHTLDEWIQRRWFNKVALNCDWKFCWNFVENFFGSIFFFENGRRSFLLIFCRMTIERALPRKLSWSRRPLMHSGSSRSGMSRTVSVKQTVDKLW